MSEEFSIADLVKLREEVATLRRYNEIVKDFGLLGYKPHHKQDLFHRAGIYKFRYLRTGNRFGKSDAGGAEDCAWALGYRPWYQNKFDVLDGDGKVTRTHDPDNNPADFDLITAGIPERPVKILIIVADWDKAEEIFTLNVEGERQGKLFKFLPKSAIIDIRKNQSGKISELYIQSKHGGTSIIALDTIKSFKSNRMGQESADWDAIHVDEPCPHDMWVANSRGLMDRDGNAWFTCTPITEIWINDMFLPGGNFRDDVSTSHLSTTEIGGYQIQSWMISGSTRDNPYVSKRSIAGFMASLSKEEIETRIEGRPAAFTGLIYHQFKPEEHIWQDSEPPKGWHDWDRPPIHYTIRVAVDTHTSTPMTVLFCATSSTGHNFYYTEIFEKIFVKDLCQLIRQRLHYRHPQRLLLEQAAYNTDPFDGITMADEFTQAGLPHEKAVKDLIYGIQRVQYELSRRDEKGRPYHIFFPFLHETRREFDRYVWDPKTGKPVDRDDHMMECLYRLVLTGLDYIPPNIERSSEVQVLNPSSFKISSLESSVVYKENPAKVRKSAKRERYAIR